jgi:glycosyltransferase involved in cell wall biosynthesis
MIHLVLITDAWEPQVNGVVTTYKNILKNLPLGISVTLIEPSMFKTVKAPMYKEIDLPIFAKRELEKILQYNHDNFEECRFHIATEGMLGLYAKNFLDSKKIKYTTAYHTKFPEFFESVFKIPKFLTKKYINWFHSNSRFVIVPSESVKEENLQWYTKVLGRAVNENFKPFENRKENDKPVLLYVGRVSKEKNIEKFCEISIGKCRKIVVGDGPELNFLKGKYPEVEFVGYKFASELALYYNMADVMVFPSKFDTFGVVVLESMSCGTPVAAYPVTGPKDQIINGVNGYMSDDLNFAVKKCLEIDRNGVANSVAQKDWKAVSEEFVNYIK